MNKIFLVIYILSFVLGYRTELSKNAIEDSTLNCYKKLFVPEIKSTNNAQNCNKCLGTLTAYTYFDKGKNISTLEVIDRLWRSYYSPQFHHQLRISPTYESQWRNSKSPNKTTKTCLYFDFNCEKNHLLQCLSKLKNVNLYRKNNDNHWKLVKLNKAPMINKFQKNFQSATFLKSDTKTVTAAIVTTITAALAALFYYFFMGGDDGPKCRTLF